MTIYILGISAYYHDSAAALIGDGEILFAAQEERFTRKKHDASFPEGAIKYCLSEAKISLSDIDFVVFYDKPLVKFERLLETYLSYAPKGFQSFLSAMPVWLKEKLYLKSVLKKELVDSSEQRNSCTNILICRRTFDETYKAHIYARRERFNLRFMEARSWLQRHRASN